MIVLAYGAQHSKANAALVRTWAATAKMGRTALASMVDDWIKRGYLTREDGEGIKAT